MGCRDDQISWPRPEERQQSRVCLPPMRQNKAWTAARLLWELVESHRTANGLRQRVVAWLGKLDEVRRR